MTICISCVDALLAIGASLEGAYCAHVEDWPSFFPSLCNVDVPRWGGRYEEPWSCFPAPRYYNYLIWMWERLSDPDRLKDEKARRRDEDGWPTRDGAAPEEDGDPTSFKTVEGSVDALPFLYARFRP